jgi:hypothetical protein
MAARAIAPRIRRVRPTSRRCFLPLLVPTRSKSPTAPSILAVIAFGTVAPAHAGPCNAASKRQRGVVAAGADDRQLSGVARRLVPGRRGRRSDRRSPDASADSAACSVRWDAASGDRRASDAAVRTRRRGCSPRGRDADRDRHSACRRSRRGTPAIRACRARNRARWVARRSSVPARPPRFGDEEHNVWTGADGPRNARGAAGCAHPARGAGGATGAHAFDDRTARRAAGLMIGG